MGIRLLLYGVTKISKMWQTQHNAWHKADWQVLAYDSFLRAYLPMPIPNAYQTWVALSCYFGKESYFFFFNLRKLF